MKVLIPSFMFSLLLLLSITAAGSIRITITQNSYFSSDQVMTLWGSLEVEDIQALAAYNDTRLIEFKQSWSKKSLNDTDWEISNMLLKRYYKNFQNHARNLIEKVLIKGAVLFQCWVGCSSSIDDIEDFTYKVALDGEDLVSINAKEGMWVAGNSPYSQDAQRMMQRENGTRKSLIDVLKHQCHLIALSYLTAGKEAYSRKIQPQVHITKKLDTSGTEVICMVTGFYPKPINVSLWKENKIEEVLSTMTLPNGDGTYQITVLSTVINSVDQQSVYCQVEHSSLKEPLIVHLDEIHHTLIGLVVGITVAVIVCVVGLACFVKLYKKRRSSDQKV
ncbi:antigen-presenting glycoprotein CD1d-like isoform X3 [Aquarana catesbeiana]|uniref:antigen-presenting glycoprotein CD1d-like isoform X3 n=1 Tax=Aquarana catesbeiana TaxID=8400 RepID=UPI003CCA1CDF